MTYLGEAMWHGLRLARLNYTIAGGVVPHLQAYLLPRWADEPDQYREGPVGAYPREIRDAPENAFDAARHGSLIQAIAGGGFYVSASSTSARPYYAERSMLRK